MPGLKLVRFLSPGMKWSLRSRDRLVGETLIVLGLMPWLLLTPLVITRLFKPGSLRGEKTETPTPEDVGEYTDSFTYQYELAGKLIKRFVRPALWISVVCIVAGGLVLLVDG